MVKAFKLPFRGLLIVQRFSDFFSLGFRITHSKSGDWNWSIEACLNTTYKRLHLHVKTFNLNSDLYLEPFKVRWNSELIARYLGDLFDPSKDEEFPSGGPYPLAYKYQGILGTHVCFNCWESEL